MTDNEGCDQKTMNPISKTKTAPAAQYSPGFPRSLIIWSHTDSAACVRTTRKEKQMFLYSKYFSLKIV